MQMTAEPDYAFLQRLNLPSRGGTTDHVQGLIRDAIVSGDLPPGTAINKHLICDRLGVSRFPVSEALTRLQAEGLVEILPQRGTRVTRIRIVDVEEAMFIRRALEAEAVRRLAGEIRPDTIAVLDRNLRYQRAAVEAGDRSGFHALDLDFHQTLVDALGFARVRAMLETARGNLDRVRRILSSPRRHAVTLEEHVAIFEALSRGDGEAAARAMARHLDQVIAEMVAFAADNKDVFDDAG